MTYPPEQLDEEEWGLWESWMTPLKHNSKTHYLEIENGEGQLAWIKYVSGDFLKIRFEGRAEWDWIGGEVPFSSVKLWLKRYPVRFIEIEEV